MMMDFITYDHNKEKKIVVARLVVFKYYFLFYKTGGIL